MIDFLKVKRSVKELKKQLANHEIDEKSFENRLLEMVDVAQDGYYWMYGHESDRWFRHDGEKWIPDDPDRISTSQSRARSAQSDYYSVKEEPALENYSISIGWFIASLIILIGIGWIVYLSSLAY